VVLKWPALTKVAPVPAYYVLQFNVFLYVPNWTLPVINHNETSVNPSSSVERVGVWYPFCDWKWTSDFLNGWSCPGCEVRVVFAERVNPSTSLQGDKKGERIFSMAGQDVTGLLWEQRGPSLTHLTPLSIRFLSKLSGAQWDFCGINNSWWGGKKKQVFQQVIKLS